MTDSSASLRLNRELDAIGLLGRDLQSFHEFAKSTVTAGPGNINEVLSPNSIDVTADYFAVSSKNTLPD